MQTIEPRRSFNRWLPRIMLLCALALSACGGSDDPSVPPPPPGVPPSITAQPADQTVQAGATASFSVSATSPLALTYQWQRNGADIAGATVASYSFTAQLADSGAMFRVNVANASGTVASTAATLTVQSAPRAGTVSLFAGDPVGANFKFGSLDPLAIDPAGNLYGLSANDGSIRKLAPSGAVSRPFPSLLYVTGMVADRAGNLIVSSAGSDTPLRKISPTGEIAAIAITPIPIYGLSIDAAGNVYGANSVDNSIWKITPAGAVTVLAGGAGPGNADGIGAAARFDDPIATAVDGAGFVYVTDYKNNSIRKISPQGVVTTLVPGSTGLQGPGGIVLDSMGNLLVTDLGSAIRKVTPAGIVTILAGVAFPPSSVDGPPATARFYHPGPLAIDSAGNLYVGESGGVSEFVLDGSGQIRRVDPAGNVTTLFGLTKPTPTYGRYSATTAAGEILVQQYVLPFSLAPPRWNLYRIASDGTEARTGAGDYFNPQGLAIDASGSLYVANRPSGSATPICPSALDNATASEIQVLSAAGNQLRQINGTLVLGTGLTRLVLFTCIGGVAVDGAGSIYLSEDKPGGSIVKLIPDGPLPSPPFAANVQAHDLAVDAAGNLYASICLDPDGPGAAPAATQIVKYTPQGAATVLAGSPGAIGSADGPGAQASFGAGINGACAQTGIALDAANNVYVADPGNHTVRKVTPAGIVSTVVGQPGVDRIVLGPLPAGLSAPTDVSFDAAGNLYVSSQHAIVKVRFGN